MDIPEFIRMKLENFPDDDKEYNLMEKVDAKGYVILRVEKGMHGLPYAGIIAQKLFEERLEKMTRSRAIQPQDSGHTSGGQSASP